eukprot:g4600.t1
MYGVLSFSPKSIARRPPRSVAALPQRCVAPASSISRLTQCRFLVSSEGRRSILSGPSERGILQIRHAILGVGAPEAILVVVVALVVFGPKGLAEAARSIGKTLKSFSPTIRELAEVSTDLKSSLEQEIGLEEIRDDFRSVMSPSAMATRTDFAREIDPDIETKRKKAEKLAWSNVAEAPEEEEDKRLEDASIEDLEAELARRKSGETK